MKNYIKALILVLLFSSYYACAQPATKSYPFAIGTTSNCGGSTGQVHFYDYNASTNSITAFTSTTVTNPVARYTPQLRIGTAGGSGGTQRYTHIYASVSYNPKDHNIYYLWTALSTFSGSGSVPRTYVWRWPVGTKPTGIAPRLDTLCSFPADLLGVAFDNNGSGTDIIRAGRGRCRERRRFTCTGAKILYIQCLA